MSRRTRTLRYGVSIALVLAGVACGALIPGSPGGTAATVLVGIGLVVPGVSDATQVPGRHAGEHATGEHQGGRLRPLDRRRGQRRRLR
jgi:hypothetical protein